MNLNLSRETVTRELALFTMLLLAGLVVAPAVLYWMAQFLLGEFGGNGFGDFFGSLSTRVRSGDLSAWFFVLSPYIAWQVLRLTAWGWRRAGKSQE